MTGLEDSQYAKGGGAGFTSPPFPHWTGSISLGRQDLSKNDGSGL